MENDEADNKVAPANEAEDDNNEMEPLPAKAFVQKDYVMVTALLKTSKRGEGRRYVWSQPHFEDALKEKLEKLKEKLDREWTFRTISVSAFDLQASQFLLDGIRIYRTLEANDDDGAEKSRNDLQSSLATLPTEDDVLEWLTQESDVTSSALFWFALPPKEYWTFYLKDSKQIHFSSMECAFPMEGMDQLWGRVQTLLPLWKDNQLSIDEINVELSQRISRTKFFLQGGWSRYNKGSWTEDSIQHYLDQTAAFVGDNPSVMDQHIAVDQQFALSRCCGDPAYNTAVSIYERYLSETPYQPVERTDFDVHSLEDGFAEIAHSLGQKLQMEQKGLLPVAVSADRSAKRQKRAIADNQEEDGKQDSSTENHQDEKQPPKTVLLLRSHLMNLGDSQVYCVDSVSVMKQAITRLESIEGGCYRTFVTQEMPHEVALDLADLGVLSIVDCSSNLVDLLDSCNEEDDILDVLQYGKVGVSNHYIVFALVHETEKGQSGNCAIEMTHPIHHGLYERLQWVQPKLNPSYMLLRKLQKVSESEFFAKGGWNFYNRSSGFTEDFCTTFLNRTQPKEAQVEEHCNADDSTLAPYEDLDDAISDLTRQFHYKSIGGFVSVEHIEYDGGARIRGN